MKPCIVGERIVNSGIEIVGVNHVTGKNIYRKSSIRSRPCIILVQNFPRLVLEVFKKVKFS